MNRVLEGPRGLTLVKLTTEQAIAAIRARDPHVQAMGAVSWPERFNGCAECRPSGQGWYLVYREAGDA